MKIIRDLSSGIREIFFLEKDLRLLQLQEAITAKTIRIPGGNKLPRFFRHPDTGALTVCYIADLAFEGGAAAGAIFFFLLAHGSWPLM
jgi:hypothetical protein